MPVGSQAGDEDNVLVPRVHVEQLLRVRWGDEVIVRPGREERGNERCRHELLRRYLSPPQN